ncbi:toll/interleukin-1 receptor domain-containing protein [Thauera sp. 63]|uniref:toll/interleukin-1 receptor domain-containing protein n=1 Tax=Thauera sp. 63 TaxID=497321 RepID=UPI0003064E06|nr:toll/interleukin-1 receptor domain-containing protein [Thauera sp. 63]
MTKFPRAFLSHGHVDKHIVREVARNLGRAAVIYDEFEFSVGDEFRDAIIKGIDRSDVFILFASRASLQRDWVKLEIELASEALIKNALSKVTTYIVDQELTHDALPEWMRATLIRKEASPGLIATDIRRIISQRLGERIPRYFVGRRAEIEQSLETISGFTDPNFRPPLIVYGLKGIGRRSLVQAIARDNLSFSSILPINLHAGDLLPETSIRVAEAISPGGISDLVAFLKQQEQKAKGNLVDEITSLLRQACQAGTLPIFVDEGALAAENGVMRPEFDALYNAISSDRDTDAMIVSSRRLYRPAENPCPSVRVPELDQTSTQNLLRIAGRDVGLVFDRTALTAIATYARGYPPAVRFILDEARLRGIPQVVTDQRALVNFNAEQFLRHLKENRSLTPSMQTILQILSSFSPLPLQVIVAYCAQTSHDTSDDLNFLLDLAFVMPAGMHYRISEPIRDAAYRAFGGLRVDTRKVAELLEAYLADEPDDDARLDLGQTIFRANLLAGSQADSRFAIGFAADLINVATRSYHDQDYDLAIKYGSSALDVRPDSVDVRRYVAQALIRKERYDEAEEHISELLRLGELKEAYYVWGFAARRKREYPEAIEAYKKSLANGRRGVAIHRELASCFFETGDLPAAEEYIRQAEQQSPHNPYVVDLKCTIALRLGDLPTAERALEILDRIDSSGFAEHRRSTFEQANGSPEDALRFARIADQKIAHPPFEVLANLANCEIEAGECEGALTTLGRLQKRFGAINHDAQVGLRCKYEIRFGEVEAAEGLWSRLRDTSTPVHRGLRLAILNRKQAQSGLTVEEDAERTQLIEYQSAAELERNMRLIGSMISQSE